MNAWLVWFSRGGRHANLVGGYPVVSQKRIALVIVKPIKKFIASRSS
jgi:hypothetical protein